MKIFGVKIDVMPIILVGVIVSGIYLIAYGFESALGTLSGMGHGMAMTAGIWIGCMTIVNFLWKKFPWEFNNNRTNINFIFIL